MMYSAGWACVCVDRLMDGLERAGGGWLLANVGLRRAGGWLQADGGLERAGGGWLLANVGYPVGLDI
ncbi:hypothetical protein D3C75_296300 [compost metagenome]